MATYWVQFDFTMVEAPNQIGGTPLTFLGQTLGPYFKTAATVTVQYVPWLSGGGSGFYQNNLPWFDNTSVALTAAITSSGTIYVMSDTSIGSDFLVGSQPDPTTIVGPSSTLSLHQVLPNDPYDVVVTWNTYAWAEVTVSAPLFIATSDTSEAATIPLHWSHVTRGAIATDTTGQIHFSDTDTSARPFATITATTTILVKN